MSDATMLALSLIYVVCFVSFFVLRAWLNRRFARTEKILIAPHSLKIIVSDGKKHRKVLQIFFMERSGTLLQNEEFDFDKCELHLSEEYDFTPRMEIITNLEHERSAKLYLPKNTEIQYTQEV